VDTAHIELEPVESACPRSDELRDAVNADNGSRTGRSGEHAARRVLPTSGATLWPTVTTEVRDDNISRGAHGSRRGKALHTSGAGVEA